MIANKNEVKTLCDALKKVSESVLEDELRYCENDSERAALDVQHMKFVKAASHFSGQAHILHNRINALHEKQKSK